MVDESLESIENKIHESFLGDIYHLKTMGGTEQWEDYSIAYKEIADHLVIELQDRLVDEPHLVLPIMFLYRQSLELALKEIINHLLEWLDVEDDYSKLKLCHQPRAHEFPGHSLMESWGWILSLIEQMEDCKLPECTIGELDVDYDAIEKRIKEFDEIDRSSYNYRYPVNTKGRPNKTVIPDQHQLVQVKDVVEAIDFHLASISCAVHEAKEQMRLLFDNAVDSYYQDRHADYLIGQWKDAR